MSAGNVVFRGIQSVARSTAAKSGTSRDRGVTLEPVAPHLVGYSAVAQAKWAAWRRKEHLESACEENLDDQIALVVRWLDPVFVEGPD